MGFILQSTFRNTLHEPAILKILSKLTTKRTATRTPPWPRTSHAQEHGTNLPRHVLVRRPACLGRPSHQRWIPSKAILGSSTVPTRSRDTLTICPLRYGYYSCIRNENYWILKTVICVLAVKHRVIIATVAFVCLLCAEVTRNRWDTSLAGRRLAYGQVTEALDARLGA
jgi:hypothetical protein